MFALRPITVPFTGLLFIFLMFPFATKADLYLCKEDGVKKLKSYEDCKGKLLGVYTGSGQFQSIEEFSQTQKRSRELIVEARQKEIDMQATSHLRTADDIKQICDADYDQLAQNPGDETTYRFRINLLKSRCEANTLSCFDDMDAIYKEFLVTKDVIATKKKATAIRAKCGMQEVQKSTRVCVTKSRGMMVCR